MARSYVREAWRRGLGRRRERIVPIVERLAAENILEVPTAEEATEEFERLAQAQG